jgi:2-dehydro-3-deoxyphosphogluconate aldolase/(4S)-4-hydroxy-2-oxoglutarate aldolase
MRLKSKVLQDINFLGLIAIVRTDKAENVIPICESLLAGGVCAIELTTTIPDWAKTLNAAVKHFGTRIIMGMGTLLNAKMAKEAADAGAELLVSPIAKFEIAAVGRATSKAVMLGAFTPTEAELCHEAGADVVKIFPADSLGPKYIKALRGPMPHLKLIATGGVSPQNIGEYLQAGCLAVGAGSTLIRPEFLRDSNWTALTQSAAEFVAAANKARGR